MGCRSGRPLHSRPVPIRRPEPDRPSATTVVSMRLEDKRDGRYKDEYDDEPLGDLHAEPGDPAGTGIPAVSARARNRAASPMKQPPNCSGANCADADASSASWSNAMLHLTRSCRQPLLHDVACKDRDSGPSGPRRWGTFPAQTANTHCRDHRRPRPRIEPTASACARNTPGRR